jgi:hypothetical protein
MVLLALLVLDQQGLLELLVLLGPLVLVPLSKSVLPEMR